MGRTKMDILKVVVGLGIYVGSLLFVTQSVVGYCTRKDAEKVEVKGSTAGAVIGVKSLGGPNASGQRNGVTFIADPITGYFYLDKKPVDCTKLDESNTEVKVRYYEPGKYEMGGAVGGAMGICWSGGSYTSKWIKKSEYHKYRTLKEVSIELDKRS